MTYLKSVNIEQSFSRAHIPYDNSVVESFFANLKEKNYIEENIALDAEFKRSVNKYINFYNTERPHKNNDYKTLPQKELD